MDDANFLHPTADPMQLDPKKAIELEQGINQGVIAPSPEEVSAVFGMDISGLPILAPDSNWDPFLSDFDSQIGKYFDTLGCNIFSSVHGCESYINALGGDPAYTEDGKTEFSERKACVDAGLNGSQGSSEYQWEQMINSHGLVRNDRWPFDLNMFKEKFFAPVDPDVEAEGLLFLRDYSPMHRSIGTDKASLIEALKYGPVKLFIGTGTGWNQGEPNIIPKTNNPMGHAVFLRKITSAGYHIYDQYAPYLKILAPDYIIYYAFQTFLIKKGNNRMLVFFQVKTDPKKTVWALQDGEWVGFVDYASLTKYINGRPNTIMLIDQSEFNKVKANPDVYKS